MGEECLICKAPLEYLERAVPMKCAVCGETANSKSRCVQGHFVCDACHTEGINEIFAICLKEQSGDPIGILEKMMSLDFCHMHGPEHHVLVGAALLTAYKNAGGTLDLQAALLEIKERGKQIPGGACGFWGACGAGISAGIYFSIATKATPLAGEAWGLSNRMTARALEAIGKNGGPRCCKRDSYLAILEAAAFTEEKLGLSMEVGDIVCSRSQLNSQCLQGQCPFHKDS